MSLPNLPQPCPRCLRHLPNRSRGYCESCARTIRLYKAKGQEVPLSNFACRVEQRPTDAETQVRFGKRLKAARIERGLLIKELSALAGLNATYIGRMERGAVNPTLTTIARIQNALGANLFAARDSLEHKVQAPGGSELESAACRSLTHRPTYDQRVLGRSASATFKELR